MKIFSDLHLHSKYSRATSPKMNIHDLSKAAKLKGLNMLGSGDFTHPKYIAEIKRDLSPLGNGVYVHNDIYFLLTTEISNIFKQDDKTRKVHNLIFAPSLEVVDQINDQLLKWGRLDYDGRPIFGRSGIELVETMKGISKDIEIVPAHAWTPWFGIFGSKSGFDSVEECFKDQSKHIFALETGLSSDPAMNWRLSRLDKYSFISFSDAHSPYPWRLGREATVFELDKPDYFEIIKALKQKDRSKFLYTIEVDPGYGKYHFDGHRNCDISFDPAESKKHNNMCPKCGRPLTIGVLNRIEELADRPEGFTPKDPIPFKALMPLNEIIASLLKTSVGTKKVYQESSKLINRFGSELSVLLEAPLERLKQETHEKIAEALIANREGKIKIKPGYDGVYGEPIFDSTLKTEEVKPAGQKTLGEF